MTSTAPRKRLTTSAMIASFADPGQRTTSARMPAGDVSAYRDGQPLVLSKQYLTRA